MNVHAKLVEMRRFFEECPEGYFTPEQLTALLRSFREELGHFESARAADPDGWSEEILTETTTILDVLQGLAGQGGSLTGSTAAG